MTLTEQLAQELPPSGRYASTEAFLAAFPASAKVKAVALKIINAGQVDQAQAALAVLQRHETDGGPLTVEALAEAAAAAGVVPAGPLALAAVEVWLEETGRVVDPVTGEILTDATRVATPDPDEPAPTPRRGELPPALLNEFHQFRGGDDGHQWGIGKIVDDAIAELAGKFTAERIIKAAVKEMEISRGQVRKCRETWAATDERLRDEFDVLTFEHFAVLRYIGDRAKMHSYLQLCVESADLFGGKPMPAVILAKRVKKDLGLEPPEPTPGELLERAIRAVQNYQAVAEGRGHERATRALELLEKVNEQ